MFTARTICIDQFVRLKDCMKFFLCVMGMVMVVEGLPYFVSPGKMKEMINMLLSMDDSALRKFGLALMASGVILVCLAMGGF